MPASSQTPDDSELVDQISEHVMRLFRLTLNVKNAVSDGRVAHDKAALGLLVPLVRNGPMRTTSLAEECHSDVSTISRHIAELVKQGFVERVADQNDGRACLLAVTNSGKKRYETMRQTRCDIYSEILANWNKEDLDQLNALLSRFTNDIDASQQMIIDKLHNMWTQQKKETE